MTEKHQARLPGVEYDDGIHLTGSVLWFDSSKALDLCFVSHAHYGHMARHRKILATDKTVSLFRHRVGAADALSCPFNKPFNLGELIIELLPAGHVLGSAQLHVIQGGKTLVYTGDINLVPSRTSEGIAIKECDVLVIESTFGHPRYIFPPRNELEARIIKFVEEALDSQATPVVFAHSLGRAQEVIKILLDKGHKVRAHSSIYEIVKIYREFGIHMKEVRLFRGTPAKGEVVVFPPHLRSSKAILKLRKIRTVYLSGWAIDRQTKDKFRVDTAIPLTDHADFEGLKEYVVKANPKKVYVTHGFDELFARTLRDMGFDATSLVRPKQLDLFKKPQDHGPLP